MKPQGNSGAGGNPSGKGPRHRNRLIGEKSPYLSAHADNPVDWYPWGDEAFARAAAENKPVFLSIGYSTCHWCHVMAHESFSDSEVARLLNASFVSVKVDREERPDLDQVYMTACQVMTGTGGWPLSVFLLPDKRPFFAATYIPKTARFGNPGMLDLLPQIAKLWEEQRGEILSSAEMIRSALTDALREERSGSQPGPELLDRAYEDLVLRYDPEYGGFSDAPKFPMPLLLFFLLRYWKRTGKSRALCMVERTLDAIATGGIYDHIGGGVHRYSTDRRWRIPHFEKMLYDQALLSIAYTDAYRATGEARFRETAEDILGYLLRDLRSDEGAFCSAEDADSGGREGAFYLWDLGEIGRVLEAGDADIARNVFHITPEGIFSDPHGAGTGNVLYRERPPLAIASESAPENSNLERRIAEIRKRLYSARLIRPRPQRDDKVLADWNGLAIAALAEAAQAFGNPAYADAAVQAASFVLGKMRTPDGGLFHRYCCGEPAVPGLSSDYSCMVYGLIGLYGATFDDRYITAATGFLSYLRQHFSDRQNGGFFMTSDTAEAALVRTKDTYDGVVPSSNSLGFMNLLRLSRLTGDTRFEEEASKISGSFCNSVINNPSAYPFFLCGLDYVSGNPVEVVIAGDLSDKGTGAMVAACRRGFSPSLLVLSAQEPGNPGKPPRFRDLTGYRMVGGKATAYVCVHNACSQPVNDPEQLSALLDDATGRVLTETCKEGPGQK